MAIGGVSGSQDLSQLNAQMIGLTSEYTDIQKKLMSPDSAYTQDQIASFAQSANLIGRKMLDLAAEIYAVISAQPKLPAPHAQSMADVGTNMAALRTNGWLAPSALMAFISAMMYFLKQEARNAGIEGQNVSKAMMMQQELGTQEAEKQREQGRLEMRKAIITAAIEIGTAVVTVATVAKRVRTMSKGATSAKAKKMEEELHQTQAKNNQVIAQKTAENTRLQAQLDGDANPGQVQVGGQPIAAKKAMDPNSREAKDIQAKINENNLEIEAIQSRSARAEENFKYQKEEMLRQELVTWEQIGRSIEHLATAATKLTEGSFNKQLKDVEAELTILRTFTDILKNFMQSLTKAAAESHQNAQDAAKAMDQFFQSHTQAYWAKAA